MSTIRSMLLLFSVLLGVSAPVLSEPLDINTADAETLASTINGVGERKALAIIQYREVNGPFSSVDDLANIKGIGMKTVENNRGNLTVVMPAR